MKQEKRYPAEWEPHAFVWTAWPSHAHLWGEDGLRAVRAEVADLVRAIAAPEGQGSAPPEIVRLCVLPGESRASAEEALEDLPVEFIEEPFGDIWLRDTAPIFTLGAQGRPQAECFGFNGWGGKYLLPHDDTLAARVAARQSCPMQHHDFILEGGALDSDGEGTLLTTRQCLLNRNRNPGLSERDLEQRLREALGAEHICWLDEGLSGDHTDGHVDNLARFVAPGVVCTMAPKGAGDPNRAILDQAARALERQRDAQGRRLDVVRIPSAGALRDPEGELQAGSHVNFYIANQSVIVPAYDPADGEAAAEALRREGCFPGRRILSLPARALIHGGGSFHCITQQVPRG